MFACLHKLWSVSCQSARSLAEGAEGSLTIWTVLKQNRLSHLGLWYSALLQQEAFSRRPTHCVGCMIISNKAHH